MASFGEENNAYSEDNYTPEEVGKVRVIIDDIKHRKKERDKGNVFCIPFYEQFPAVGRICPGIVKGIMYKITAQSGIGKTKFAKNFLCIAQLEWMRNSKQNLRSWKSTLTIEEVDIIKKNTSNVWREFYSKNEW